MSVKIRQIAAAFLVAALCLCPAAATASQEQTNSVDVSVIQTDQPLGSFDTGSTGTAVDNPLGDFFIDNPGQIISGGGLVEDPVIDVPQPDPETPGDPYAGKKMRVGLAYPGNSTGALVEAKLLNADASPVSGYRLGYYDEELNFIELARTQERALSMVKTTNIYRVGETYYDSAPAGSYEMLGCYHLQRPYTFSDYTQAQEMADNTTDGFVAWVDGAYYVRKGSYPSFDAARAAADQDAAGNWTVAYTGVYGINIVKTGTCDILLQFDGGQSIPLGIMPGIDTNEGAVTWFKGYKYYGGFRYERVDGGNLVVVSIVDVDTYVKGVVPYESNKLWPLETLKAQAMCAKNYGLINLGKHNKYHFDVCNTVDCQVYRGAGSGTAFPSDLSDQAVDETSGQYVWYNGKLAQTYFASSNGGGSEDVSNVWGSNQAAYPYLMGVVDPYEASVADVIPSYKFSNTFTCEQLTGILQTKGYATGTTVVDFAVTEYSKTGNVLTMKFTYANGKSNTFTSSGSGWLRSKLGCRSMHFTVTGAGQVTGQACPVNGGTGPAIENFSGLYALSADGTPVEITQSVPSMITGTGEITLAGHSSGVPEGSFVVSGAGNGHNVGYSQWGGYAMGKQGFTYDEILKFYFTGVDVGPKVE